MKPKGISRWTPADHMYDVGCLKTTSCACMPNGRSVPPVAPPEGLSTLPLDSVTIGWNGGLPPSSVESFSVTRLWNTPALVRRIVFSLTEYDSPIRGSNTL